MNTIVVLLAFAAVAIAAPSSPKLGEGLKPTQQQWSKTINREKKSPTFEHHHLPVHHDLHPISSYHHGSVVPTHIHEHHLGLKPIHGHKYGHGYIFRDEEAEDTEEGKCAKEIKEKCRKSDSEQITDSLKSLSDNIKIDPLEKSSRNMEGKVQDNILLARAAIDNMQQNLGELEKSTAARSQWKHAGSQSDVNLHSNIETAKRALEQVQKNFENLHSKHADAPSLKEEELHDITHIKEMTETERMSQWKEAIDTIQKNVEIANNIKGSFLPTNTDKETVDAESRHAIIIEHVENLADNKDKGNEMEMSASNTDVTMMKPIKSSENEKSLRHNADNEDLIKLNIESTKTLEGEKQHDLLKAAVAVDDIVEKNKEDERLKLVEIEKMQQEEQKRNAIQSQKDSAIEQHEKDAKEVDSELLNQSSKLARETSEEHEQKKKLKLSHDMHDMMEASSIRREDKMKFNTVEGKHAMVQSHAFEDTPLKQHEIVATEGKNAESTKEHHKQKFSSHENNQMDKNKITSVQKNAEVSMKSTNEDVTHQNMKMQSLVSKQLENDKLAKSAETDIPFMKAADNGFSQSQIFKQEIESKKNNLHKVEDKFRTIDDETDFNEMSMRNSGKHLHHHLSLKSNDHLKQNSEMRAISGKPMMKMPGSWNNLNVHEPSRSAYGPSVAASLAGYGNGAGYGAGSSQGGESGSEGAVGVFPSANVGGCAVPLLLSCSPSVVSGSLAKAYPAPSAGYGHAATSGSSAGYATSSYGAASSQSGPSSLGISSHGAVAAPAGGYAAPALSSYRTTEDFRSHSKRHIKRRNP